MSRSLLFGCFVALAAVQLAVPTFMIDKRETTLEEGSAYKFNIGPVDPYDPFLGRYLVLELEAATLEGWKGDTLHKGQTVYAVLDVSADGFATIVDLSMDAPGTRDYLKVRVAWHSADQVRLDLPFSRYYLEEHAAQAAWRIRRNGRRQPVPAYIQVRVHNGFGVLEELYFEDTPLLEYMRARGLWSSDSSTSEPSAAVIKLPPEKATTATTPQLPEADSDSRIGDAEGL